ncbi:MAG: TonB-dependent receptor [Betaproteobacteria bacterium]
MKRMHRKKLSLAVVQALNAGVVVGLAVPLAYAQSSPPVQKIEKIEVTGSRIPVPLNLESTSPVTEVNAQDIKFTGLNSTSDILNQLPQAFADYGGNLSNGATGTATVNLRNLGSARTLVLIDGKRVPAGSPTFWATDLNAIPAPLIQRVEVLTGGASAVYGSDAVAGVVNFIMNDHFEGIQLEWNANGYNHQQHNSVASIIEARSLVNPSQYSVPGDVGLDGQSQQFSLTMGSNFANGKGNATVFFSYQNTDPVLQKYRDFSSCALGANAAGFNCGGSGTSYPGQFFTGTSNAFTIANAAGAVRPYVTATDAFNFGPYNYFQRPDERYNANVFIHYDVFPNVRVYGEFDFMDDHTLTQIAPSGLFGQSALMANDNPLLSQSFKDAMGIDALNPQTVYILRRNLEGGGRTQDIRHTQYRYVLGAKGDVLDNKWDYDFFWQSGKVIYQQTYTNDFSASRANKALDVVTGANGQPVCRSVVDGSDPLCVPYDIFHIGGVTQAALDYLQTPGFQNGSTEQSVLGLHITSDLGSSYGWTLPWAKNGVGVALGYERRTEKLNLATDTFFSIPEGTGQGGPTIGLGGGYTVNEFFGEVRVPIIEKMPFAELLSVNGSYRYSDYSTNQTTESYGLGAEWAPVKQVRLRTTYQQAVRAANIIELFTAQGFNLFNLAHDPCAGGVPGQAVPTATLAQCQATGLAASQYGARILDNVAGQYNFLQGGNPTLSPEKAKSYTFGVVLEPIRNLSATIDYWKIKVDNEIGIVPSSLAISQCINSGQFCDLIHRDAQGTLWLPSGGFVTGTNINLGSQETSGIDFSLNYIWDMPSYGSLGFNFIGTYLKEFVTEPVPGLGSYDCAGLYGPTCGTPLPEFRSKVRLLWTTPWNWTAALTWRYFSSVDLESTSSNPQLAAPFVSAGQTLSAQNYFDIAASWNIDKNFTIRGGVNNIADRDPPLSTSTIAGPPYGNGNTYPQVYDSLGRTLFLNVTAKF